MPSSRHPCRGPCRSCVGCRFACLCELCGAPCLRTWWAVVREQHARCSCTLPFSPGGWPVPLASIPVDLATCLSRDFSCAAFLQLGCRAGPDVWVPASRRPNEHGGRPEPTAHALRQLASGQLCGRSHVLPQRLRRAQPKSSWIDLDCDQVCGSLLNLHLPVVWARRGLLCVVGGSLQRGTVFWVLTCRLSTDVVLLC